MGRENNVSTVVQNLTRGRGLNLTQKWPHLVKIASYVLSLLVVVSALYLSVLEQVLNINVNICFIKYSIIKLMILSIVISNVFTK